MESIAIRVIVLMLSGVFAVLQTGCSTAPTAEKLANADFGPPPSEPAARAAAEAYIRSQLKDPGSATFTWGSLDKGWFKPGLAGYPGKIRYAWSLPVGVNAKNSFGGYTGMKPWLFYFRGEQMVGIGEPSSHSGGVVSIVYFELPGVSWPESP